LLKNQLKLKLTCCAKSETSWQKTSSAHQSLP
jgi:hypothetical protein